MLLVAVGHSVHLGVPVADTPGSTCSILKRQAVVLQHVESYEELLRVFSTAEHGVERHGSTRSLLDEGVTELDVVGACRERHAANHQRHYSRNDFMM